MDLRGTPILTIIDRKEPCDSSRSEGQTGKAMARNHLIVPEEAALATIERMDEEALAAEMDRVIRYVEARTGWLFGLTAQEMVDSR